jgi:hypothetical protein
MPTNALKLSQTHNDIFSEHTTPLLVSDLTGPSSNVGAIRSETCSSVVCF